MLQLQPLELFAFGVKVDAFHRSRNLVEADVIEPFKAGSRNLPNPVVWNQKVLLPAHKYVFLLCKAGIGEVGPLGLYRKGPEGGEPRPVLKVVLFVRAPLGPPRLERVLVANHLTFKVGCERRMILSETWRPPISKANLKRGGALAYP